VQAINAITPSTPLHSVAITSAVIAIAGVVLSWIAIEIACKPCLEQGRNAIDHSLNPDYDPDDDISSNIRAPPHLRFSRKPRRSNGPRCFFSFLCSRQGRLIATTIASHNSSPLFFSGIFQTAIIQFKGKDMKKFSWIRVCARRCDYLMFFVSLGRWLTDMNCLTLDDVNGTEIVAYMFVVLPIV
jgi:hypothetical protein